MRYFYLSRNKNRNRLPQLISVLVLLLVVKRPGMADGRPSRQRRGSNPRPAVPRAPCPKGRKCTDIQRDICAKPTRIRPSCALATTRPAVSRGNPVSERFPEAPEGKRRGGDTCGNAGLHGLSPPGPSLAALPCGGSREEAPRPR